MNEQVNTDEKFPREDEASAEKNGSSLENSDKPVFSQLADAQPLIKVLIFFTFAPVATVVTAAFFVFFWIEERYQKRMLDNKTSVVDYVNNISKQNSILISNNSKQIGSMQAEILNNKDELSEMPDNIYSYTICILDNLKEYSEKNALKEASAVGLRSLSQRNSLIKTVCSIGNNARSELCTTANAVISNPEDYDRFKSELDKHAIYVTHINNSIQNCRSQLIDEN